MQVRLSARHYRRKQEIHSLKWNQVDLNGRTLSLEPGTTTSGPGLCQLADRTQTGESPRATLLSRGGSGSGITLDSAEEPLILICDWR